MYLHVSTIIDVRGMDNIISSEKFNKPANLGGAKSCQ